MRRRTIERAGVYTVSVVGDGRFHCTETGIIPTEIIPDHYKWFPWESFWEPFSEESVQT
jgi:hypothetical protein